MQKITLLRFSALLAGLVLLCGACSPDQKPWTHNEFWINPQYKDTKDFHGTVVQTRGNKLLCKLCHGISLQGSGEVRGCYACHFGPDGGRSPAGPPWEHGLYGHDTQALEEPVCTTCHALYRSYGLKPGACHDCHALDSGQHPMGQLWLDKKSSEFHGKSTLVCSTCHNLTTDCASCHFGSTGNKSPAGSGWTHGTTPHTELSASQAVCTTCHDLNRSYGNGPAACHDCHGGPPGHVTGQPWLDPKSAQFHGTSTLDCSSCHDTNKTCSQCHFGKTGIKSPPGSSWIHGTIPHKGFAAYEEVCNQCHTLERSFGNGPASCHDCHGTQAHVLGDTWLNPNSAQFHGKSTLTCNSCHNLEKECSSCHFGTGGGKSPAGSGWTHGTTPHSALAASGEVCNRCHELDRRFGKGPGSCHDCHGTQSHVLGDPWLNPNSTQFHGTSTLACGLCHNLATECSSCHFGAGGSKSPAGSGWTHGIISHGEQLSSSTICNRCHDLERSYATGPALCHDCHRSGGGGGGGGTNAGHPRGQPWLDPNSAQFHGTSTLVCSTCHNLTTDCASCHFGSTGNKSPAGSGWTHGTTPHSELAASEAVCNQCHTLERSYGNGPASCHDCHSPAAPHAVPFANHGGSAKMDLIYCQQCHAQPANGGPGSNPRFNVSIGSLGNGCESSGCHKAGTAHPVSWTGADSTSHQSAQNMAAACALCHGADLSGGSGPACSSCHTGGSPLTKTGCTSCHAKPPSGAVYPDAGGAHAVHNALSGVTDSCAVCHAGAGSQTAFHDNGSVDVAHTVYHAKSGTAAYTAADQTCSNVSCHGGQKTPPWGTGIINVNTQCTLCHTPSRQYNSYTSGEHRKHVQDVGAACSECHDTAKLAAVHFNDLSSTAMTEARQTIRTDLNYNGSSCSFTCHLDSKRHTREMTW